MCRSALLHAPRSSSAPLIVEVSGPRGVGKSTFVKFLKSKLDEQQIDHDRLPTIGKREKFIVWLFAYFCSFRTRSIWSRWRSVTLDEQRVLQRRFWRYRYRMWRSSASPGVHILDEGVYQLMLMLMVKTKLEDRTVIAKHLRRMVRFPDLVIVLSASDEDIRDRRKLRGNARDLIKPVMSETSRAGMKAFREMLEQLPGDSSQVIFVESIDLRALQEAANETASLIFDRAREVGHKTLIPNAQ